MKFEILIKEIIDEMVESGYSVLEALEWAAHSAESRELYTDEFIAYALSRLEEYREKGNL